MTREQLIRANKIMERKIAALNEENAGLKRKVDAAEDLQDLNLALCTTIVRKVGALTISQDEINEVMDKGIHTVVERNVDKGTYTLRVLENEKNLQANSYATGIKIEPCCA